MPPNAYEERIELLEKAIIALVGRTAMDELDELNAHPHIDTWAEYWMDHWHEVQAILDEGKKA